MNAVGELVSSQWYVFCAAMLLGAALCFCYDLFRVIRRVIPHNMRLIAAEDFVYWIFWTLAVMTMLDALDKGAVRGFSLGAVFSGMLIYLFCFSRFVLKVLVFLFGRVKKILQTVWNLLSWPWKKFIIFFRPVVRYNKEKFSGVLHGKKDARDRKQKQKKEKSCRENRGS